jgi:NADH:ubiquinone oxidoreductase subunit H
VVLKSSLDYSDYLLENLLASEKIFEFEWLVIFNLLIGLESIFVKCCIAAVYVYVDCIFFIKILLYLMILILIRAHLPRYRFDQLIDLCWKTYLPLLLLIYFIFAVYLFLENIY